MSDLRTMISTTRGKTTLSGTQIDNNAAWTKFHKLKEASLWSIDAKKQSSWIWNSILSLRPVAENLIRCQLGNRTRASFWFDHWCELGLFTKICGPSGPRELGISVDSSVSDAFSETGWRTKPT
ncbi:hypothetical protein HID58_029481 [Brassica napus]|uniref:Reverse transcriptase zinc-binding domain-containing protein n=1 Tax=Brassica napus TaxID=3708 RepID=A0ABQ8CD80_BRANA|nr:hypothetical protein HID58_029481 [Brassica napus]